MATQQQAQQPQPQRQGRIPKIRLFIAIIAFLLFTAAAVIGILININSPSTILFIIFAILSALFALFQWLFPLSSTKADPPAVIPSTPPVPSPSQSPTPPPTSYRGIIGLPPPTDPRTIQQREKDVKAVYHQLTQPGITAIALTGIGGIGKSTLAALIYRYAEDQRRTRNGPFTIEPLWLTIIPAVTMTDLAGTLVEALGKAMLDLATLSPQSQAAALFNALNTVDKPRLIILDQFENLLDWQTGQASPDRVGVGEWLDALNSQPCRCRVLLTSRPDPQGTREYPPTFLQTYHVEGLEESEGIELLRKQGVTGTEAELRTVYKHCAGHAFSLTLLASLLRARKLSLITLLQDPAYSHLWTGKVAQNLLDSIYKQLDETQRRLLIAFSVIREPVPLEAAQAIIEDNTKLSRAQAESPLEALLAQHLLQVSGEGRYQPHVIVASYAQDHIVEGNENANREALKAAHARAAQYYLEQAATSCPPREQRHLISDVHYLVEAIWEYCQAGQQQEAYKLIEREHIFTDLNRWGGNAILLKLYILLFPDKWHPEHSQVADIYYYLGWIYDDLGKKEQALSYYQQALAISKEVGDRSGEGSTLSNLGGLYDSLGDKEQALSYYQQALAISKEVGDRSGEGSILSNLGLLYNSLGKKEQALSYYQQALAIRKEVGNRKEEGTTLWNIGALYLKRDRNNVALACFLLARGIFEEVQSPNRDEVQNWINDLQKKVGKKRFATLLSQVESQAHQIVEQTLHDGMGQV